MSDNDESHMAQALALARRGLGTTWPNPSVGCVVVGASGEIVGRGVTAPGGRPHAEAVALDRAGRSAADSTLYVTLAPCAHEGRGAACSDAIAAAAPARVVVAMDDPDPRTAGHGIARLRAAGIEVTEGVLHDEACEVTLGHVLRVTEGRPAVTLKLAVGSDGLVPRGEGGAPTWLTGDLARAHAHLLRARTDAILVGRGTVVADNPSLTCRLPGMECRSPVRVILDRRLRTPTDARLFEDEMVPVWFICARDEMEPNAAALQEAGPRSFRSRSMLTAFPPSGRRWTSLPGAASPGSSSKAARRSPMCSSTATSSMRRSFTKAPRLPAATACCPLSAKGLIGSPTAVISR